MRQPSRQLAFDWEAGGAAHPSPAGESSPPPAPNRAGALAGGLVEAVVAAANLRQALRRVRRNRGSPGVDGMTVDELPEYLKGEWPRLREELLAGRYEPQPVKRVEIPKAGGGKRQLGIPTVVDRFIQQAILQVLSPLYDPTFSPFSYGFRPGKSTHQALFQAREYVAGGREWVVDLDLEQFFDRVNHDILMGRLANRIGDRRLLRLIRRYLEAGVLLNGVVVEREEGTPQGGPLSPLLANILLDELDQELARRGHQFCRYADDCNIYVRSQRAGERVMASVTRFLETRLRLKVNRTKSAVGRPVERKFLGYRIVGRKDTARLGIAPQSLKRVKDAIRRITKRNRGVSFGQVVTELRQLTDGWVRYFRYAPTPSVFTQLDQWIRRRLRCYCWKQWKTRKRRAQMLRRAGLSAAEVRRVASSNGYWRMSGSPALKRTLTNAALAQAGFHSLAVYYQTLAAG